MSTGRFVWYDLMTQKTDKAVKFYTELFGWGTQTETIDKTKYTMFTENDEMIGGVMTPPDKNTPTAWVTYLSVNSIESAAKYATQAGGTVLIPPTKAGDHGRFSLISDRQGATINFWQSNNPSQKPEFRSNRFFWNELHTSDVDSAKAFYGELAGWTFKGDKNPSGGTYWTAMQGNDRIAGIVGLMSNESPNPYWLNYVMVNNVDATVNKTEILGGKTVMAPTDIPDVGRIAVLKDPVGATFALIKWAMM
jgi:predicted enzyme related to lactoylglutathione lyase